MEHAAVHHRKERRQHDLRNARPRRGMLPQGDLRFYKAAVRRGISAGSAFQAVLQGARAHGTRLGQGLRARELRHGFDGGRFVLHPRRQGAVSGRRAGRGGRKDL